MLGIGNDAYLKAMRDVEKQKTDAVVKAQKEERVKEGSLRQEALQQLQKVLEVCIAAWREFDFLSTFSVSRRRIN